MTPFAPIDAVAGGPRTRDADEFQLPIPGLYADLELGTASLRLPDAFLAQPSLLQLQVLADWQRAMTRYRRAALERLSEELSRGTPGLSAAQRQDLLRRTCSTLHIELPEDLGARPASPAADCTDPGTNPR